MRLKVPIGKREGLRLEFKSLGSLKRPDSIAREVVAMLNAQGGEVWIGLVEHDGIATREEHVPDAQRERERLLNVFLEKIDPAPTDDEIELRVLAGETGADLLRIDVRRDESRVPYALRAESLLFLKRVDHRVRAMTRAEILGQPTNAIDPATHALDMRRDAILARPDERVWLAFQPSPPAALDSTAMQEPVRELLSDATRAGNRRSGWTYAVRPGDIRLNGRARPAARWEQADATGGQVSVASDGCVEFCIPLALLENHQKRGSRELHPLALLEYVISGTRLVQALRDRLELTNHSFLASFVITIASTAGWTIPQYAPGTWGYRSPDMWPPQELGEVLQPRARLQFPVEQLASNPDRVGFRIVREIYELLGLTDDRIPAAYDRSRERLTLTD